MALALWLVHALVDYDWDFVAVTGPAFFAVGALAPAGGRRAGTFPFAAAAAAAVALASAVALATPWLAEQSVRAQPALERGARRGARAAGRRHSTRSRSRRSSPAPRRGDAGDEDAALAATGDAAALQPETRSPDTSSGSSSSTVRFRCSACLRPTGPTARPGPPAGAPGGELDRARAWVNPGLWLGADDERDVRAEDVRGRSRRAARRSSRGSFASRSLGLVALRYMTTSG